MDTLELQTKLRRAYEWGRLRRATSRAFLLLIPITGLVSMSPRVALGASLGAALMASAILLLWRGELFARAVLPGLVAGGIPIVFASLAMQCGPGCSINGHCMSWCIPACTAGGAVAALFVARAAPKSSSAPEFWISAGLIANLTGALGCSCYSLFGTLGLLVAFVSVSAPAFFFYRGKT
jgi:hypothetical protein